MDIETRAFDCCFGYLTGGHTDGHFDHSLSAPGGYVLAMPLAKRPQYLFTLLVPYTLTALHIGRF